MNGYNFTDRVRKVLQMARDEAIRLNHEYVGTEHLLLAVIREGEGVGAAVLMNLNVDFEETRQKIGEVVRKGTLPPSGGPELPYTSRAKKVLELAMIEAREFGHSYVGTEHLLLGLVAEEQGIAAQILTDVGVTLDVARAEVLRLLGKEMPATPFTGRGAARGYSELSSALGPGASVVLMLARDTAASLGQEAIDTEHLLIALLNEDGEGASILRSLAVSQDQVIGRLKTAEEVFAGSRRLDIPYSSNARRAIWLAVGEALSLGHDALGSGHVLLGLLRAPGVAGEVLRGLGVTEGLVRERLKGDQ